MRNFFRGYTDVIYDSNCIVYQCFCVVQETKTGDQITIDQPPFTSIIRKVTDYLRTHDKRIGTLQVVFEQELDENTISDMVRGRLQEDDVRHLFGFRKGEGFPWAAITRITDRVIGNFRKFTDSSQPWFFTNAYRINRTEERVLISFFVAMYMTLPPADPLRVHNDYPDYIDLSLIDFSREQKIPLISNDKHITLFREELLSQNLTHKIIPLMNFENII